MCTTHRGNTDCEKYHGHVALKARVVSVAFVVQNDQLWFRYKHESIQSMIMLWIFVTRQNNI